MIDWWYYSSCLYICLHNESFRRILTLSSSLQSSMRLLFEYRALNWRRWFSDSNVQNRRFPQYDDQNKFLNLPRVLLADKSTPEPFLCKGKRSPKHWLLNIKQRWYLFYVKWRQFFLTISSRESQPFVSTTPLIVSMSHDLVVQPLHRNALPHQLSRPPPSSKK